MANYYQEGQTTSGKSDNETVQWLKTNNLSHLIPVFENGLSLSELAEMPKNELTEILEAMGLNKIDLIRVRSKIAKFHEKSQPLSTSSKSPPKPQRVIITEAETAALNSLDEKHKALTAENKSIQDRLSEFEAEYRKQEKFIHDTFKEIQSNIDKRKNILLNEMKVKSDEYRQKLSVHMKSVANQRGILSKVKEKCENDINHSNISSLQQATQRANKTVALIDETLLSLDEPMVIQQGIFARCDIANREINDNIKTWGVVKMIGHKPPAPTINIVTLYPNVMTVELLTDQSFGSTISKYEIQMEKVRKSNLNRRSKSIYADADDMKSNEVSVVDIHDNNIAFHKSISLQQETEYQIRARGLLQNGECGEWTQLLVVKTPASQQMLFASNITLDTHKQSLSVEEWLAFCNQKNITLTSYQQQRIFYYLKTKEKEWKQRQQAMSMMFEFAMPVSAAKENVSRTDTRVSIRMFNEQFLPSYVFNSAEWRNMQKEIREKGSANILQKQQQQSLTAMQQAFQSMARSGSSQSRSSKMKRRR